MTQTQQTQAQAQVREQAMQEWLRKLDQKLADEAWVAERVVQSGSPQYIWLLDYTGTEFESEIQRLFETKLLDTAYTIGTEKVEVVREIAALAVRRLNR